MTMRTEINTADSLPQMKKYWILGEVFSFFLAFFGFNYKDRTQDFDTEIHEKSRT